MRSSLARGVGRTLVPSVRAGAVLCSPPVGVCRAVPVKILFVMRHPAAVRSLGPVLRLLDERGHQVQLAFGGGGIKPEAHRVLQRLADEGHGLTFGSLPGPRSAGSAHDMIGWRRLANPL